MRLRSIKLFSLSLIFVLLSPLCSLSANSQPASTRPVFQSALYQVTLLALANELIQINRRDPVSYLKGQKELFLLLLNPGDEYVNYEYYFAYKLT